VKFNLIINEKGFPQARNVQDVKDATEKAVLEAQLGREVLDKTEYIGTVARYDGEKGFGFIECEETRAKYNRDVFIHKSALGNFEVGMFVKFQVELNEKVHKEQVNQ
jgi:cold shock CspA family protein